MKKLLILAGTAVVLIVSCITNVAYVVDETIPSEHTTLVFTNIGTITGYNGIPVNWAQGITTAAQIPAGETQLQWDIKYQNFFGSNMLMHYVFLPQKQYIFEVGRENSQYGIKVYMYNAGERIDYGSARGIMEHYVEFVPFLNSGGKTVLN
jgi:hypothetical protein